MGSLRDVWALPSMLGRASLALSIALGSACATEASDEAPSPQEESLLATQPPGVKVGAITMNGTGCPANTWKGECPVGLDGVARCNINFSQYTLQIDNAQSAPQSKNCVVNIPVQSPAGTQVAISRFQVRAMADLQAGAKVTLKGFAGFVGWKMGDTQEHKVVVDGPFNFGPVELEETPKPPRWTPCSFAGSLQITTALQLTSSSGIGVADLIEAATHVANRADPEAPGVDIDIAAQPCKAASP